MTICNCHDERSGSAVSGYEIGPNDANLGHMHNFDLLTYVPHELLRLFYHVLHHFERFLCLHGFIFANDGGLEEVMHDLSVSLQTGPVRE